MTVKNILVKISGDLVRSKKMFNFLKKKARKNFVVVICGGGSAINEALKSAGIEFDFGPAGRITTFKGRQIARNVLEERQAKLQDKFVPRGINAVVVIPVIDIGTILCHANGDKFLKLGYNTFDELYCLTEKQRMESKKEIFVDYPKIKVIGI